ASWRQSGKPLLSPLAPLHLSPSLVTDRSCQRLRRFAFSGFDRSVLLVEDEAAVIGCAFQEEKPARPELLLPVVQGDHVLDSLVPALPALAKRQCCANFI